MVIEKKSIYVCIISLCFRKTNNADIEEETKILFMLRIFRFKMESDCFENGLEFFRNLSGARYCVPKSKDIRVKIPQLEEEQLTKIQNVLGAIFSSHSRWCCFHSTIKKKLIFRSNNQTIT